jgi:TATA-box binding protein (TBP) (component of TFIID and TFIIIB)
MVKRIVEIDLPEEDRAREIYRGFDPQMVVVLRGNGDVVMTRYEDRKDATRCSPMKHHTKKILEMKILK